VLKPNREVSVGRSGSTFAKRQKEIAQMERAKDREARRVQRRTERGQRPESTPGEDPDIAGIIPGPQPVRDDD
jgi:hypothetical protein